MVQDLEVKKLLRNLQQSEQKQNSDQNQNENTQQLINEYSTLNEQEIKLLQKSGVSAEQFHQSRFPIIRFSLLKDGRIENLEIPINLRIDQYQVYINILEQLIPRVSADIYNIIQKTENGKTRILKKRTRTLKQRTLNGDNVNPEHEAQLLGQKQAVLKNFYTKEKHFDNNSEEIVNYIQNQFIELGGVIQTQVDSLYHLQDNQKDEQQIFKKIQIASACTVSFVSQKTDVGEYFLELLKKYQSQISVFKFTWNQALKQYQNFFKRENLVVQRNQIRSLQQDKQESNFGKTKLGQNIDANIFQKNIASIAFGANLFSQCFQSKTFGQEDFCNIGIKQTFNSDSIVIAQKQVKFNATKIFKIQQFIISQLDKKIESISNILNNKFQNLRIAIQGILDKTEKFIDLKKNPILIQISDTISKEGLQIANQIQDFEKEVTQFIKSLSSLIESPLKNIQEKTQQFLSSKQINFDAYVNQINQFAQEKYKKLLKFVDDQITKGLNPQLILKIRTFLTTYDIILKDLVENQVRKYLSQLQTFFIEKQKEFSDIKSLINDSTQQLDDISKIKINQQVKDFLISGIADNIQKTLYDLIEKITNNQQIQNLLTSNILKQLQVFKTQILEKLDLISKIEFTNDENQNQNEAIQITKEMNNIQGNIQNDLLSGIKEFQQEIDNLISNLKSQIGNDIKQKIIDYSKTLINFSDKLTGTSIQKSTETLQKVELIGQNVLDNLSVQNKEILQASNIILDDLKAVYNEMKSILSNPALPGNGYVLQNSVYSNINNIFNQINTVFNQNQGGFNGFIGISDQILRIKALPNKFQYILNDLKQFTQKPFDQYSVLKSSFLNINKEGQALQNTILSQVTAAKSTFASKQAEKDNSLNQLMQAYQQISLQGDDLAKNIDKLDEFLKQQKTDVQKMFQDKILEIKNTLDFNDQVKTPEFKVPIQFTQYYNTPMGIRIKLLLEATSITKMSFDIQFRQAILNLKATIDTKVILNSQIVGDVYVAQVGGYAQGTILDAKLETSIELNALEKFKGKITLDGSINPLSLKLGIYYTSVFTKESDKCIYSSQLAPQQNDKKNPASSIMWIKNGVQVIDNVTQTAFDFSLQKFKNAVISAQQTAKSTAKKAAQINKDAAIKSANATNKASQDIAQAAREAAKKAIKSAQDAASKVAQAKAKVDQANKDQSFLSVSGISLQDTQESLKCLKGYVINSQTTNIIEPFEFKSLQQDKKRLFESEIKGLDELN
ncbi:hypothetical protein IMG5_171570 [Ichthyophthirius multifiliis]|uniref:Uncharacterized protein n=1 Tax=Ichthyophthirius multifiliis TaxID=5932 RepID=G0R1M8_ICHMU|nr:hypothetical protein IMG5_171570 [Ichthyophthirius multifiliis]EGR28621.1 hypothetical protein IMG5_171570 [Ichthyophthirius multifiliis]|eukprot:XP_004029857.1 hypothetical protein IMG5_171570 [Ichthyophthirius multifiliis]